MTTVFYIKDEVTLQWAEEGLFHVYIYLSWYWVTLNEMFQDIGRCRAIRTQREPHSSVWECARGIESTPASYPA